MVFFTTHKIKHVHRNLERSSIQGQTYYLCILAALSELLHSIRMLNVVHRDRIDHHHSIILSKTIQQHHSINTLTHRKCADLYIPVKHSLNNSLFVEH